MAKIKNNFTCSYCRNDIKYHSNDALKYDDKWYCCQDCLNKDLDVDETPWIDEREYEITEDETNGFGVRYLWNDAYSNNVYIIFDKCPFEFDDEYRIYFDVYCFKYSKKYEAIKDVFKRCEDKFEGIKVGEQNIFRRIYRSPNQASYFITVLGKAFDIEYFSFVVKQLTGKCKISDVEMLVYLEEETLYMICNGKRAAIKINTEMDNFPGRFEACNRQIDEVLETLSILRKELNNG